MDAERDEAQDEVARLLERLAAGDQAAGGDLFGLLYDELRRIAGSLFRSQRPGHTLEPTVLVHEAWMKMLRPGREPTFQDRVHFLSVAARAMRQVLVNHARDRAAQKRGAGARRERLTFVAPVAPEGAPDVDVLDLEEALERLAALDERQARIAELRFFAGLTTKEVAEVVGIAPRTVELDWKMAKDRLASWLGGADA